jgi:SAM-dependent methyltransferase
VHDRQAYGIDLDRLDDFLARLAASTSDDELRRGFAEYRAEHTAAAPADPFSPAYRDHVLAMYAHISGRRYDTANEVSHVDVVAAVTDPFPYLTRSARVVGEHLMLVGQVVRLLAALPSGSTVLDCGAGWGNTTVALAKSGYAVTALEVEERFVQLISARARHDGAEIEVVHADYLGGFDDLIEAQRTFDAIVFFESFHHCDDPARLVSMFDRVVAPGGFVVFASEPVFDAFPVPWGLRLDGESLWAIRANGWMELGYRTDFFRRLLLRHGWLGQRSTALPDLASGGVFVARRVDEIRTRWSPGDGLVSAVGTVRADGVTTDARAGFLVFGPYGALPPGPWRFVVHVDPTVVPPAGRVVVDIVVGRSQGTLARRSVALREGTTTIELDVELLQPVDDLEVRVQVSARTRVHVTAVEARALSGGVTARPARGRRSLAAARRLARTRPFALLAGRVPPAIRDRLR